MDTEIEALEKSDYLVLVSRKMKDYVTEMGIATEKVIVAPNGSDQQESTAKYGMPLKVIYAGTFAYWEKVHDFVNIAKHADPEKFKFYKAGDGPLRNDLLRKIRKEHISIDYLGCIPKQKIHKLLAQMQIGIAPSTKDLARQVASPIKIFDYMASGLPVITPKIGDWGDIIEKENCGIALNNDNIDDYLKALNTLAQENIWKTKSRNAIKSIEQKSNWNKVLEPITNLLLTYEK